MATPQRISHGTVQAGGFWSQPQANYSASTQQLLKEMMNESKLTNFQQRHLEKTLRGGGSLPTQCPPTHSVKKKAPQAAPQKKSKVLNPRNYKTTVRTKDQMEAMGAFDKPDYMPPPNAMGVSRDKEKKKLSNIMEFGTENPPTTMPNQREEYIEEEPDIDRFDELQLEMDERRRFLAEMESLGQGPKYRSIISTEISQLLREMEVIDKKRTKELERLIEEENKKKSARS